MIKRLTWFVSGAVAGVAGVRVAKRRMKRAATHFTPKNIAYKVTDRMHDAFSEGRKAMRIRELELRAELDGNTAAPSHDLDEVDEVLVDGRRVGPGHVIVLKQVRDRSKDRGRRGA